MVHARGSFTLVFCHSFYGQGLAAERAGEQSLQGFDLAPAALPRCLDDTRLQPSYLPFASFPVDLVPMFHGGWGCTRDVFRVHLRFPHRMVLPAFSSFMTCWKSACLSQRSCRFLSVPLQNGLCFFQHPLPANLSATLTRRFPRSSGEASGVSMF